MTIRLLVTMRDMAAAAHLAEVLKSCGKDARFETYAYAQEPAAGFLFNAKIPHTKIDLPPATGLDTPESTALINQAKEILNTIKPDAVLSGLSTPLDGGIDEAILANADVPTFLLQDFWGEQNTFFGKGADTAFVLDDIAAKRNMQRFKLPSIVSGSIRHAAYKNTNWPEQRKTLRKKLSIKDNEVIIGFFAQALNHLPGYWRTVQAFINAVSQLPSHTLVAIRHHPRENQNDRKKTLAYFENTNIRIIEIEDGPLEDSLSIYDVVCSLFSNCTLDASYQNWYSDEPMAAPVSMLFDPEIVEYCRQCVEFEKLPIHTDKLVTPVYE